MVLRTKARDCLYVNWALPMTEAPPLPDGLRYDIRREGQEERVFLSALFFQMSGLRPEMLPLPSLSYPQLTVRLYVLDGEQVPSALFLRVWVPPWVVPVSRYLGGQPATAGQLDYPAPSEQPGEESWTWQVQRGPTLRVQARMASPGAGEGPSLGPFPRTVDFFRRRLRAYAVLDGRLRALERSQPQVEVWPMQAEVADAGLLHDLLPTVAGRRFLTPHSAFLCPEIPFTFQLSQPLRLPLPAPEIPVAAEPC